MIVLGIETSCDETAVGIVNNDRQILANIVYSQIQEHKPYGGVVPEIAARAHVQTLDGLIREALATANLTLDDINGIAATCGPGLIGGVMVGMMTGKAIAAACDKPFLAVNHLEAHVLTPRLTNDVPFPYLTLLISGGHTQILLARDLGDYVLLGGSLDDACGEAFDKSAKLMGLPYPGGPMIEQHAKQCTDAEAAQKRFPLPRPMVGRKDCDFSFSGLKTAMRLTVEQIRSSAQAGDPMPQGTIGSSPMDTTLLPDLCASLQTAIGDILCDRIKNAAQIAADAGAQHFVVAGGVAANLYLRARLDATVSAFGLTLCAPPVKLCTDNGVMIAWAGLEQLRAGHIASLDTPRPPPLAAW